MTYADYRCWDADTVDTYIKTESRQKSREIFERTHLAIDRIKADFCKPLPDEEYVSEDQILDLVLQSEPDNDNRIFLLVGETGSGKSEFCQWLEYNIDDEVHVPIHISRSTTSVAKISAELDKHLDAPSSEAEVKEITDVDPENLADLSVVLLQTRSTVKGIFQSKLGEYEADKLQELYESDEFHEKLVEKAEEYHQNVKAEKREDELDLLTVKDFHNVCEDAGIEFESSEDVYSVLKREINDGLKENLHIGDFIQKLRKISQEYHAEGKRPVLILEDLTTFQFLKEDFMDYIFDISEGHYDVVIGWTTGFERKNIDHIVQADDAYSYMRERLQARFEMNAESGSTYFLEDRFAELTRKYLKAVFEESPECDTLDERIEAAFDGLFPFNEALLARIYQNLIEGGVAKQTPRLLLDFVVNPCLKSNHAPHRTVENLENVDSIPPVLDRQYPEAFRNLVKWYGEYSSRSDDQIVLDADIPEILGIPIPDGVEQRDGELVLQRAHSPLFEDDDEDTEGPDYDEINEIIQEHEDWLANGSNYPSRDEFRDGVVEAIARAGDPITVKNPLSTAESGTPIRYTRGSEREGHFPVYIDDSGDDLPDGYFKVGVERDVAREDLYFWLLTLGLRGELPDDANREQLRTWCRQKVAHHQDDLRAHIEQKLGMEIEEFVLFSKFLLDNLMNGSASVGPLKEPIRIRDIDALDDELFQQRQEELVRYASEIEGLFRAFFFLKDSMVDYETLVAVSEKIEDDKAAYLDRARSMDIDLGKSFKIGSDDGENLQDLVEAVRDYAEYISKIQIGTGSSADTEVGGFRSEMEAKEDELLQVESRLADDVTAEDLQALEERLKESVRQIEEPWRDVWGAKFSALKESNVDIEQEREDLQTAAEVIKQGEDDPFNVIRFIHRREQIASSPVYQAAITVDRIVEKVLETDLPEAPEIEEAISDADEMAEYKERLTELRQLAGGCP